MAAAVVLVIGTAFLRKERSSPGRPRARLPSCCYRKPGLTRLVIR